MQLDPGQIILVAFPFSDHTATKVRPALVVSAPEFNRGEDFVALPISARISDDPHGFPIRSTDPFFAQTRLRTDSTVRWTKVMTLTSRVVTRKLGTVPAAVLQKIQELVRTIFS
jgi:mRNA interferase MazF